MARRGGEKTALRVRLKDWGEGKSGREKRQGETWKTEEPAGGWGPGGSGGGRRRRRRRRRETMPRARQTNPGSWTEGIRHRPPPATPPCPHQSRHLTPMGQHPALIPGVHGVSAGLRRGGEGRGEPYFQAPSCFSSGHQHGRKSAWRLGPGGHMLRTQSLRAQDVEREHGERHC